MTNSSVKGKFLFILLILFPVFSFAGNPFLHMLGKPYADYFMELKLIHYNVDYMEQSEADSLMAYMEEAAKVANNRQWKIEEAFFRMVYRYRYNTRILPGNTYTIKDVITDFKALRTDAKHVNDTITYLRTLRGLMNAYVLDDDYDNAFETAKTLNKALDYISVSQLPEKIFAYQEMADMHYRFRNYVDAEVFYRKITEEPVANCYSLLQPAYNGLGLIYRDYHKDYGQSDAYFRQILTVPYHKNTSDATYLAWKGIVNGNLGSNLYLQEKYDEAIPLLETSRVLMLKVNDYTFASHISSTLANIYLKKKNLTECKRYIDLTLEYVAQSYPMQLWAQIYPVMAKYYAMIGQTDLAVAYQDSAFVYQKKEYQEYDALKLVYVEQRVNRLEQKAKDDVLLAQQIRAENYRDTIILFIIGLFLILGLLIYAFILYRRKRAAYRILVKRNQEWADARKAAIEEDTSVVEPVPVIESLENEEAEPNGIEWALMEQIRQLIDKDKVYTNSNFSLTDLATLLEVNRNYVSATINRCTGNNFAHFINEYRISEAIDIMSLQKNASLTIDQIAYSSGFNDRKSFYRAFKKVTGLAPSEFRANMTDEETNS